MPDKILVVDDDADLRNEICDFLDGYNTIQAASGDEAMKILKRANEIGLVILDVMMPGTSGLDALAEIKKTDPGIKIIILTGHSSKDVAIEALQSRADDFIEKSTDVGKIKESVERLMDISRGNGDLSSMSLKDKIEKVKKFVERNCYRKTGLKEAAESVCLSPKYLSRCFEQVAGIGFTEYKLKIKINKAKELLAKSGYNVNQVSEKLGYENAESFIRQFKKLTKSTPTEYRNKLKKKKAKSSRRK